MDILSKIRFKLNSSAIDSIFDASWYVSQYSNAIPNGCDPLQHYLEVGWMTGYNPSPLFDTEFYLNSFGGKEKCDINPLLHFVTRGARERKSPHRLFDTEYYYELYPDVLSSRSGAFIHYLRHGAAEGRSPHPLFDGDWYISRAPSSRQNPLRHYLLEGRFQRVDPHPLFLTTYYLALLPHLQVGSEELISYYIDNYPFVNVDPNPVFNSAYYQSTYPETVSRSKLPLLDYIRYGAKEGKNPSENFDAKYYLESNPDVRASGMNPLAHFLRHGAAEGRKTVKLVISAKSGDGESSKLASEFYSSEYIEYSYSDWLQLHYPQDGSISIQRRKEKGLPYRPLISIIVPVYKVSGEIVSALISSVQNQTYSNWEICVTLAYHEDPELTALLQAAAQADHRVKLKILSENGGISANSNEALKLAGGEFIALLDHDDILSPDALFTAVDALNTNPRIDFIYSDKDTIDATGNLRFNPLFKPAWSPEWMLSVNYLTHLCFMRTSRVREIEGWDPETDGAQDWDIFLRFIKEDTIVHHISKPLYHWRTIPTSVASGLGAKPWAAAAQLRALTRYLDTRGWAGASAFFRTESLIQVKWSADFAPRVLIVVVGKTPSPCGFGWRAAVLEREMACEEAAPASSRKRSWLGVVRNLFHRSLKSLDARVAIAYVNLARNRPAIALNRLVGESPAEVVVFLDADVAPETGWLSELVGPLQNPAISAVGGRVASSDQRLREAGWVFIAGKPFPLFEGEQHTYWGIFGGANGYRNHLAVSGALMAVRRSIWDKVGGFRDNPDCGRFDLDLGLRLSSSGQGRVMLNNYACAMASQPVVFAVACDDRAKLNSASPLVLEAFPNGDPYFHPSLEIVGGGRPALKAPATPASWHYVAEAKYMAAHFDAPASAFVQEPSDCGADEIITSIAWFLPNFDIAFYGGIMTILRAADYIRKHHDIHTIFVVLTSDEPNIIKARIARAFPELAIYSDIKTLTDVKIDPSFIKADAAVATLWTTAYAVLRMNTVKKRFYFMQDYEPLFYPAGTTYSLAAATYRFGFLGVCNTQPLHRIYESLGGRAEHFLPAVDTNVFHRKGRMRRKPSDEYLLFNYARPGHPRNCFEVVSEGLVEAKRRLKDRIKIVTAGAEWDPKDYDLSGVVEHLGLLSYEETGRLYRSVDAGIVAMATPHPSYLPFELMACGAVVLTNRNPDTRWLLKDRENCFLFDLTRSAIAETIEEMIESEARMEAVADAAAEMIRENYSSWSASCETIATIMLGSREK